MLTLGSRFDRFCAVNDDVVEREAVLRFKRRSTMAPSPWTLQKNSSGILIWTYFSWTFGLS